MSSFRQISRFRLLTRSLGHRDIITPTTTAGQFSARRMSDIRVEKENGFAVLYLSKKPVNSYSKATKGEINAAIADVEADPNMQGLIIASDVPNIFSAGLDLTDLYGKPAESNREFTDIIMQNWLAIYSSRLTTIAAINGHALAGGAVTALLCDYRIMGNGRFTIGVNESRRDIVIPPWLNRLVLNTIGPREAERAVTLGTAYTPDHALRVGFVDEVVDQDKVMERAREEMEAYLKLSPATREGCKQRVRQALIDELANGLDENSRILAEQVSSPEVQENMRKFINGKK